MSGIKVTTAEGWATVYFHAEKKNMDTQTIELNIDLSSGNFSICSEGQEMVNFNNDTIEEAELRLAALKKAIEYIKAHS